MRFPVLMSRQTIDDENRLFPGRCPPYWSPVGLYRYIRIPELFIDRERSPGPGVPRIDVRPIQPRVFAELAFAWNSMEAPKLLAGPGVEGHQVCLRELH